MKVRIGLLGAGRIGRTHAAALAYIDNASLEAVFDPIGAAAEAVATSSGARCATIDEIMSDPTIDAVLVCTPTDLHADQVEQAARAGKAIFCEKPIDLDADRVRRCLTVVEEIGARLMVGFNRRFDPSMATLQRRIAAGEIGAVELVQITSRDPAPPPVDYIRRSGGLFRDMMIHDFDMARFLIGADVTNVFAGGSVLVDPAIGEAGDVDTATATLFTASGAIATITNSRRAAYGYDQRVEVHGSKGMLSVGNQTATTVAYAGADGFRTDPLLDFFMDRYAEAYRIELAAFVNGIIADEPVVPTGEDGLKALLIADAATRSATAGTKVAVT